MRWRGRCRSIGPWLCGENLSPCVAPPVEFFFDPDSTVGAKFFLPAGPADVFLMLNFLDPCISRSSPLYKGRACRGGVAGGWFGYPPPPPPPTHIWVVVGMRVFWWGGVCGDGAEGAWVFCCWVCYFSPLAWVCDLEIRGALYREGRGFCPAHPYACPAPPPPVPPRYTRPLSHNRR